MPMPAVMATDQNTLRMLAEQLRRTGEVNPTVRSEAEKTIVQGLSQSGFGQMLLSIMKQPGCPDEVLLPAAIQYKNYIKKQWKNKEGEAVVLAGQERKLIKEETVSLTIDMVVARKIAVYKQLCEALHIIAAHDWPAEWESLIPQLLGRLGEDQWDINNGVLKCLHSVTKRYRLLAKSLKVEKELIAILDRLSTPLLKIFQVSLKNIEASLTGGDADKAATAMVTAHQCAKIFYSLSYVDLPRHFEDSMTEWFGGFHGLLALQTNAPAIVGKNDDDDSSILDKTQAAVCHCLSLYIEKYEEEFEPFLKGLLMDVWQRLLVVGPARKFDTFVARGISFLEMVAKGVHHALFAEGDVLEKIATMIIIPNAQFRECDEDEFEGTPEEYIHRDIEGSDTDTRRRACSDLLKTLRKHYERQVTQIFAEYINKLMQEYHANPENEWKKKDVIIYLLSSLAITRYTILEGVKELNPNVPVEEFLLKEVLPELERYGSSGQQEIIQADCLKAATVFRNQIKAEYYPAIIQCVIKMLESDHYVVSSYAAITIHRFLSVADTTPEGNRVYRMPLEKLSPMLKQLMGGLFSILNRPDQKDSEYVMRAVCRVISRTRETITPFVEPLISQITSIVARISQKQPNAVFNHYVFEAMASIVRYVTKANPQSVETFEKLLFPSFQYILSKDVIEFTPYVYQLLAQLLETNPSGINQTYLGMLPNFYNPSQYERDNPAVPALVRLLQAYIRKDAGLLITEKKFVPILAVFQKLLASPSTDHHGFYILEAVVDSMKPEQFQPYLGEIFTIVFQRYTKLKTEKFTKSLVIWLGLFVGKQSPEIVINAIEAVQQGFFCQVWERIFLKLSVSVTGFIERKIIAVAMIRILTSPGRFLSEFSQYWIMTLNHLIAIFETDASEHSVGDEFAEAEQRLAEHQQQEGAGYTGSYSALMNVVNEKADPFSEVKEPREAFIRALSEVSARHPNTFLGLIGKAEQPTQTAVQSYMQKYGVSIQ